MKNNEKQFYLVDFQVLPEAIKKTIRIKESLKNGRFKKIFYQKRLRKRLK